MSINNRKDISKHKAFLKTIYENSPAPRKRLADIANTFECYDLDPEENQREFMEEAKQIKKLREQYEKSKKHKDKEQKVNNDEKEKLNAAQKAEEENKRKYQGKNINKDHNGEIIFIKRVKPEKLKQDFIFGKTKFKTIMINENEPKKKNLKKEITRTIDKNDGQENLEEISKKKNLKSLPRLSNPNIQSRASKEDQDKNDEMKALSQKKRFPIITGGSNFNLINAEVGVSIKEDEKYKTGGLDFFSKFKKFSLKAYDKKLKEAESFNLNNIKKTVEIVVEEPKSQTVEDNLYHPNYTMGYSTSYGNNYSSIQTEPNNYMNMNVNNVVNRMYSTNNSSMFNLYMKNTNYSNINEKTIKTTTTKKPFNPFIQLTMGSSSLMGTLERLNLGSNEEEKNHIKRRNIFRETRINTLQKESRLSLNDINIFTKNLVTQRFDLKKQEKSRLITSLRNPGKPNNREIIQEVGLKGKILRSRSKHFVPIKSNFLETESFFKL